MTSSARAHRYDALSVDTLDGIVGDGEAAEARLTGLLAELLGGIERWYSVAEMVRFFGRTTQWYYEREGLEKFRHRDGTLIVPMMAGGPKRQIRRFNLETIQQIALSMYRDGNIKWDELIVVYNRIAASVTGGTPPDPRDEEE